MVIRRSRVSKSEQAGAPENIVSEFSGNEISVWAGWLLIFSTGAAMTYWTWGAWPDVIIDFGRELYVAWRLTEGDVLYRDIAYFNGPFSPYLNSVWFSLFGVSLRTLVVCNLLLLAGFTFLLYKMVETIADQFTAVLAGIIFLVMFAFLQLLPVANFNYVTPYSHEATHGTMLAFASLYFLWGYDRNQSAWLLAASGFSLGLVALTKIEVFAAGLVTDSVFLGMLAFDRKWSLEAVSTCLAIFVAAAIAPSLASIAFLGMALPWPEAFRSTGSASMSVLNQEVMGMKFYRRGMGLDRPVENFVDLMTWSAWYIALLGPAIWIGLSRHLSAGTKVACGLGWAGFVAAAILFRGSQINWSTAFRPLPLIIIIALVALGVSWFHRRTASAEQRRIARLFSIFMLAFVLLGKMILNARLFQYGFFLAMPATILLVVILFYGLPRILVSLGGSGFAVRVTGATVLGLTATVFLATSNSFYQGKQDLVGQGGDEFRADFRGPLTNRMLEHIDTYVRPEQTLAVLPEGVILNYLSRRASPVPYITIVPPEMAMFGEDAIFGSLQKTPPDFIVIVHRDTSGYGYRFFGIHYGQKTMSWIRKNYWVLEQVGATPFTSNAFGMQLLARRL
jgi:hypothetical protein